MHEHEAVEQPVARQAWNDTEEQNRLSVPVSFSHELFHPINRVFAHVIKYESVHTYSKYS